MKKVLLSLVAVFTLATANAQEEKVTKSAGFEGRWWVAGGLTVGKPTATETATSATNAIADAISDAFGETGSTTGSTTTGGGTTITLKPTVGTFITDDITVGLGLNIGITMPEVGDTTISFEAIPLARKYWSINDKFFIYGQADVPLGFNGGSVQAALNVRPGIDYFVAKNFSIEASFGQLGYDFSAKDFTFNVDSSALAFGFKYFF